LVSGRKVLGSIPDIDFSFPISVIPQKVHSAFKKTYLSQTRMMRTGLMSPHEPYGGASDPQKAVLGGAPYDACGDPSCIAGYASVGAAYRPCVGDPA
jgi:hypothetical protein